MTFLNAIMLAGMAAVAIPIIIHILNRRRAHVVDWGAMQFLEESLASRNRRILIEEIILMGLRCLLLALLALALARPFVKTGRLLGGDAADAQDVAIVLDGSLSMTLDPSNQSNFQRALDEAHQVVDVCRPGDAVSVILAGPTPQAPVPTPLSDRQGVHKALEELTAPGGSLGVLEALHAATLSLAGGSNPAKKIILITDGQSLGWDVGASQRWRFLAEAAESLPTRPMVIVRTLPTPGQWSNASAAGLSFSRAVIGTDRSVEVTATVANTGTGRVDPEAVELHIDGKLAGSRKIAPIAEGASSSVIFEPRLDLSGPHVVSVRVVCEDDLPGDNQTTRVVNVLKTLPVLILQGSSSARPWESDADFLKTAMVPLAEQLQPAEAAGHLIVPKVVDAADVASVKDFGEYAVVVLADVPRLPAAEAEKLTQFVAGGGGLLIAPGAKASRDFYNRWTTPDGRCVAGCRLVEIRQDLRAAEPGEETSAHIAPNTIDHPSLKLLVDASTADHLSAARIKRHWVLDVSGRDDAVTVGASLDTGDPYLVERKYERGYVLTLALPLNMTFSDLQRHGQCFLPMVHELVYYLAAPSQRSLNLLPGEQLVYAVPGQVRGGDVAEVVGPRGRRTRAALDRRQGRWQASYALTASPGLYRLALPDAAIGELATRPVVAGGAGRPRGIPFVALSDPDESRLDQLADDDYRRAGQYLQLARAETLSELTAAIRGGVPGSEIWRYLAVIVLILLLGEIVATRVIAVKRKVHLATPVSFGAKQVDAADFRGGKPDGRRPGRLEEVATR